MYFSRQRIKNGIVEGEGAENETSTNGIKMDNYPSSGLLSSEERIRHVHNTVQFSVISDNFPACPSYNHNTSDAV